MKRFFLRFLFVSILLCLLTGCVSCLAEGDLEEIEFILFDENGSELDTEGIISEVEDADAAIDPRQPVYEADGTILLTMSFTGDVTIGSNLQSKSSIFEKELDKHNGDITFAFRNVKEIFEADDLTMVNFEGTLTTSGKNPEKSGNDFLFRADPSYVELLTYGGVDTVSLENNHVLDMGADGLAETKHVLTNAGITYASENEPAIFWVKGVKIGSLAYQTFGGRHDEIIAKLPADIQALRDVGCSIVIISFHWGAEKDYAPNDNQVKLGRAAIDAGADLVVGHHSHRINPIEYYNGHYICYSLGNFSFAGNNKPDDMATFIFQVRMCMDKDGSVSSKAFKIIPCRISSRSDYNDFTPTPYTKESNINSVLKVLASNGKKLKYAVESYPLQWEDEQ